MNLGNQTYLRRTAAAITAAASLLIADTAAAQTFTLNGVGGNSCNYQSMSVQPNGNFVVNCQAAGPATPGEAGTFSLASTTLTIQTGSSGQLNVNRTVGTTDTVVVPFTIAGAGCTAATGNLTFPNASPNSQVINIAAIAANSTCTVTLGTPTRAAPTAGSNGPVLGTQLANITVTAAGGGGGQQAGCPTQPANMLTGDLGPQSLTQRPQMISGQIITFPLPTAFAPGSMLGVVRAGETTATPVGTFFEATISKCRGEIKTAATGGTCYVGSNTQNLAMELYWFFKLTGLTAAAANAMGGCVALEADGPYYLNVRWTYAVQPPWGYGSFVFQWQGGGM